MAHYQVRILPPPPLSSARFGPGAFGSSPRRVRVVAFELARASDPSFLPLPLTSPSSPPPPKSAESKKEEFRRYLEKSGVVVTLTRVLVGLYEEEGRDKVNALDYVRSNLRAPPNVDVDALRRENDELRGRVQELEERLREAQA